MRNEPLIKEVVLTFVSLIYWTHKRLFFLTFDFVRKLKNFPDSSTHLLSSLLRGTAEPFLSVATLT